jgi:hypothetical protein
MDSNIFVWFKYAFNQGRQVQEIEHSGGTVDGRGVWKNIEIQVESVEIKDLEYNRSLESIYVKMDKLIKKYSIDKNEFEPKYNHFFMQLKNLVKSKSNFEIKLFRLLQIAFNAGQLSVNMEKKDFPKDITEFVHENNLLLMDTYVSKENQDIINKQYLDGTILDKIKNQKLGGFNKKYLKYDLNGGSNPSLDINHYKYQEQQFHRKYLSYKAKYLKLKTILKKL